jgi:hypothetical protein
MALLTDDHDIRDVRFWMELGGNGDYYISLMEIGKRMSDGKTSVRVNTRISMSGGKAPTQVKIAAANLFRAMEEAGLNKHPKDDER